MTEVTLIPREHVKSMWGKVSGLIEKAIAHSPGRYDIVDLYERSLKNELVLWIAFDDTGIKAAWFTRAYTVPLGLVMSIEWLGGEDIDQWEEKAISIVESYARDNGCTRLEMTGREGWKPFAVKHGFSKLAVVYEKEL